MTDANAVDVPARSIPSPKPPSKFKLTGSSIAGGVPSSPPTVPTGDGQWLTTGECYARVRSRLMDMSLQTFRRLLAEWRATGNRPERLAGIEADLERRSRYPDKSNQARWLRLEPAQDRDSEFYLLAGRMGAYLGCVPHGAFAQKQKQLNPEKPSTSRF